MSTLRVLTSRHPLVLVLALGLVAAGVTTSHAQEFSCDYDARVQIGTIAASQSPYLNEASGLVQSRTQPDVFWSHQDNSGDERIFAIHRDGTYLGTWDLAVGPARDPEDIAIGPGPVPGVDYIYFGDVGYNNGIWGCTPQSCSERDLRVWRAVEPSVDPEQAFVTVSSYPADTITLKFPDAYMEGQRQDVEALMVDPLNGDIYIVTKRSTPGMVFRAPFPHSTTEPITMEWVADLPFGGDNQATGGDISADGRFIIVRRYHDGYIWERTPGSSMADALNGTYCYRTGLSEAQGEAVAFDVGNSGTFYTTSEGGGSVPIYLFRNVNDNGSSCSVDGDCDDGLFCNGAETCNLSTNVCEPGTAVDCDDGVACTVDSCDEATDSCDNTTNDVVCDDGNVCTSDTCDSVSGCLYVDNTDPCEDGNLCTENDVCSGGTCQGGSTVDCSDGIACTDDSCDPGLGCLNVDNCASGETCNLTLDVCEIPPPAPLLPITIGDGWRYLKGTAEPTPGDLTAWTQVTFDDSTWSEGPSGIGYDYYVETGGTNGNGDYEPHIGTQLPDMRNCAPTSPPLCNDPGYVSVYMRKSFTVTNPVAVTSLTFQMYADDGYVAYLNGTEVARLRVTGTPPLYDTGVTGGPVGTPPVEATIDLTASIGLLVPGTNVLAIQGHNANLSSRDFLMVPQLSSTETPICLGDNDCDDGIFCNGAETCSAGDCQPGTPVDCNDGLSCTADSCNEATDSCDNTTNDAVCDDGNGCTSDTCDSVNGCQYVDNTDPCDDGNACTENDVCTGGTCQGGSALDCDDGNGCTNDSCDSVSGCQYVDNTDPCDDGNACTESDVCAGGACQGGSALDCDDGNGCTNDTCDSVSGCQYVDNTDPCDDGNVCTESDVCTGGTCQGGSALDCGDGITCTDDSCDPGLGCLNVDNCASGETCNVTLDVCELPPPPPLLPITAGSDWHYLKGTAEPTPGDLTAWTQVTFDDSTWSEGPSGIGYDYYVETGGTNGNGDYEPHIGTQLPDMRNCAPASPPLCNDPGYLSVYMRKAFTVTDPATVASLTFQMYADDGYVAYLNGTEVARLRVTGTPPPYNTGVTGGPAGTPPVEATIDLTASIGLLVPGTNVLAIQGHNANLSSRDFLMIPQLSSTDAPICIDDNDCDDGIFCNGVETCAAGECQPGTPVDCDDAVACTVDSCNETTDSCDHVDDDSDGDGVCDALDGHPDDPDRTGPNSAGTAVGVDHAWQTVWLPHVYQDPVVIVGPPSYNGADPGVAQVQGVGPSGFDLRFAEWEYLDGMHWMKESVSHLVLEKGRYVMDDGSIWEVGSMSLSGSQAWFFKTFSQPFPGNPQLFLTVQTVNSNPVTARARNVKANGFGVALFDEEALTGGHPTEEIGYLAIYSPAGFGEVSVDGALTPYRLQAAPVDRRFASFLGFSIKLQEDRSADQEDWHLDETVALLGLGTRLWAQAVSSNGADPFSLRCIDPVSSSVAVEWGTLSTVDHNWSLVPLAKSYVDPIVVVKPASNVDSEPGTLRVRNIDEDSFEVRFEEWSYLDGTHMPERVFYIVAEAGQHDLGGLAVEAGKLDTDKVLGPAGWSPVSFATAFTNAPAVFASIQTVNESDPAVTRVRQRSTSGFEVTMQEEEASGSGHAMETVGWIAIDAGTAIVEGRDLEIFVTGVDHQPGSFVFTKPLERRYPFMVTDVTTADDEDTCSTRFETVYRLGATVMLQEEQSVDAETDHGTEDLSVFSAE